MASKRVLITALGCVLSSSMCWASQPLSAIDWLSQSVEPRPAAQVPVADPGITGQLPSAVTTVPLGPPVPETTGLVAAADLGIPRDLWAGSTAEDVAQRLAFLDVRLPANGRDLLRRVLISRQASPLQGDDADTLLKARVDVLLEMGALNEARLLLGAEAPGDPELFRRWFDIALLTGSETAACRDLTDRPELSPTYPARIFCLARNGDWEVAAITLGTAESLGILTPQEDALLARFLDPELFADVPPAPRRPTPLLFRLYEAAGDRLPTIALPVAFAHADLTPILGWRTRIDASERLARAGVISPGDLFAVYSEERAAASGGVWDRISALSDLNSAIEASQPTAKLLDAAFRKMSAAGLGVVFAVAYRDLPQSNIDDEQTRQSLLAMAALQGRSSIPTAYLKPGSNEDQFLSALAAGTPEASPSPTDLTRAISEGFQRNNISGPLAKLRQENRNGEALLLALDWIGEAAEGDLDRLAEAISHLRHLGLTETARRIALELMIEARRP